MTDMLPISLVGGLVPMISWGIADFLQSISVRKLTTAQVMFVSNMFWMLLVIPFAFFVDLHISFINLSLVIFSSLFQMFGMIKLYESMKIGEVSIVAPITASYPLVTVMLLILLLGHQINYVTLLAIFIMMIGIALASTDLKKIRHIHTVKGVKEAVLGLIFFGFYFFMMELLSKDITFLFHFPAMNSFTFFFYTSFFNGLTLMIYGYLKKGKLDMVKTVKVIPFMFTAEIIYLIAWLVLTYGFTFGDSAIVTAVSSLYPAITTVLALIVYKEKLVLNQVFGILMILLGLFIVSL